MQKVRLLILLLAAVFGVRIASAGDVLTDSVSRPVTQAYSFEIGGVSILDTYLSPLRYHGYSMALSGTWAKALPQDAERATMQFDALACMARALNPRHTAAEYLLDFRFAWGMNRRWQLPEHLQLTVGGTAGISAGVIYLARNSNNPASAKASIDLSLRASLSRPFRIGRLPVLVSETVSLPTLSLFFSPQYGEPYYEIYLGNHAGLAHVGWWGNHFCIDNLLTADLDFGRTALRIGYRYDLRSSYICDLNTQISTHSFVIGVIPHGLGLRPKPSPKNVIINALY